MDWDKLRSFTGGRSWQLHPCRRRARPVAIGREPPSLGAGGDLRAPLFHRHARGLILTEQGEFLFRAARTSR